MRFRNGGGLWLSSLAAVFLVGCGRTVPPISRTFNASSTPDVAAAVPVVADAPAEDNPDPNEVLAENMARRLTYRYFQDREGFYKDYTLEQKERIAGAERNAYRVDLLELFDQYPDLADLAREAQTNPPVLNALFDALDEKGSRIHVLSKYATRQDVKHEVFKFIGEKLEQDGVIMPPMAAEAIMQELQPSMEYLQVQVFKKFMAEGLGHVSDNVVYSYGSQNKKFPRALLQLWEMAGAAYKKHEHKLKPKHPPKGTDPNVDPFLPRVKQAWHKPAVKPTRRPQGVFLNHHLRPRVSI